MSMTRRTFLQSAAGAAALGMGAGRARAAEGGKPNFIFILVDDLGYGELGCYGQQLIKTPNIDKMAAEGMRFTDNYAGSNLCAPSRCVLMTGLHTGHCYVRDNRPMPVEGNVPIPADSRTVAKVLKTAGYATACIGKWGLGYPGSEGDPLNQGFDHFFGYNCQREAHEYYPQHLWQDDKMLMLEGNVDGKQQQYSHDLLTEDALRYVQEHQEGPFFLYLAYTIPHSKPQIPDLAPYATEPWTRDLRCHAAMITRMDRDVGRLFALLEELGIDGNTLVMFASDNGPHGGYGTLKQFNGAGPLRGQKTTMWEGGIRVPLIARWPGHVAGGSQTEHVSGFQDILPTFAELAGVDTQGPTDGITLTPTLLGKGTQAEHEFLYWERNGEAVRMGEWKAIRQKNGKMELYNLKADLGETHDVAQAHPEIVARINEMMNGSHQDTPWSTYEYDGPNPPPEPEKISLPVDTAG